MNYSKKKHLDYMVRTLGALHASDSQPHTFINNPGFGNIFDILNENYSKVYTKRLERYFGVDYAQTIIKSL